MLDKLQGSLGLYIFQIISFLMHTALIYPLLTFLNGFSKFLKVACYSCAFTFGLDC